MAQRQKKTKEVDKHLAYVKGVAKSLVDRVYGPAGPAWGTKFSELEETIAAFRQALTEEMLHQALSRQAAQVERPPEYSVCPACGRPTRATDPPEERRLETGNGDGIWRRSESDPGRCQKAGSGGGIRAGERVGGALVPLTEIGKGCAPIQICRAVLLARAEFCEPYLAQGWKVHGQYRTPDRIPSVAP